MSANSEIRVFFALRLSALYKIRGVFIPKCQTGGKNNRGISPRTLRFVTIREKKKNSLKILSLTSREIGYKMGENFLERVIIGGYFHTAFSLIHREIGVKIGKMSLIPR